MKVQTSKKKNHFNGDWEIVNDVKYLNLTTNWVFSDFSVLAIDNKRIEGINLHGK